MSGSLEEAYVAVERAYGEGNFAMALTRAEALQPEVNAGRADLLDQRLQLLIGHIHLYGLSQPTAAAAAYSAVLAIASEPAYRELASQGLALCQQQNHQQPAAATEPTRAPEASITAAEAPLPATPWLNQLQDPQQALHDIQAAWVTVVPAVPVVRHLAQESSAPSSPWQDEQPQPGGVVSEATTSTTPIPKPPSQVDPDAIVEVVVSVETDPPEPPASAEEAEPQLVDDSPEPSTPSFTAEEWADLCSGLLLVDLTGSSAEAAPTR